MTIQDIYNIFDAYAPFSLQESYDKSGLLVGDPNRAVRKILLTLDITTPVVLEAAEQQADLIISHHPVIWDPIRSISPAHPVWHLVKYEIGAIASHTCLDIAEGGLNDFIGDMMTEPLGITGKRKPLALLSGGRMLGKTADLRESIHADALAEQLAAVFHCSALRYYAGQHAEAIRKIAWCSGSGGDLIADAISAGADALITGDCKHSVWAEAQNRNFTLFDCGHFETEVPVVRLFSKILSNAAPELELLISEKGTAPFFQTCAVK